jgi:hypothetical protein
MQTDPSIPCGTAVPMHLDLTAAESPGLWGSDFSLYIGQPQPTTPFSDAMEGGENGWTSLSLEGSQSWALSDFTSHSPSHSWVISEARIRTDTALRMPLLPALGPNAELRFWHRFSTENNYDGGVLEYSTNGATWIDAADLLVSGGYNSSVVPSTSSPLAGRDCWAGDSVEWKEVVVDLSSLAGRDVRLRWRFATNDKASIGAGWAVDDVSVRATSYACSATPPGEASGPESASPFTIERAAGGYDLAWSAPAYGAAPTSYELYRTPLAAGPPADPVCEAGLGTGTAATLSSLTADQGFLVVARSAWGDGSYGRDSDGAERPHSTGAGVCP